MQDIMQVDEEEMHVAHMIANWDIAERNTKLLLQQPPPFTSKTLSPV